MLHLRRLHSAFRQRYFFDGKPLHAGGPKDLAWIGPDGHEVAEAAWHARRQRARWACSSPASSHGLDDDGRPIRDQSFLVLLHAGDDAGSTSRSPALRTGAPTACIIDTRTGQATESDAELRAGTVVTLTPRTLLAFHALAASDHPRGPLALATHACPTARPLVLSGRR